MPSLPSLCPLVQDYARGQLGYVVSYIHVLIESLKNGGARASFIIATQLYHTDYFCTATKINPPLFTYLVYVQRHSRADSCFGSLTRVFVIVVADVQFATGDPLSFRPIFRLDHWRKTRYRKKILSALFS